MNELKFIKKKFTCGITNNSAPVAIGTGLVALDIVFGLESNGKMWVGGSCGNVMTILRYLGWRTYPIAHLRNDRAARVICEDLSHWGVSLDFIILDEKGRTPIIIEKIGKNGRHRFIFRCPENGRKLPKYKPVDPKFIEDIISKIDIKPSVFYFDRVSRGAIELARVFADLGAVIVFEPTTIKNEKLFYEALTLCHILKYSGQQLKVLKKMKSRPIPLLEIETLGSKGLKYRVKDGSKVSKWRPMKAYQLSRVVDTAGAGDWCTAGIIHVLCQEGFEAFKNSLFSENLELSLKFGQALATLNCLFEGARGSMYSIGKELFFEIISKTVLSEEALDFKEFMLKDSNQTLNYSNNIYNIYKSIESLMKEV